MAMECFEELYFIPARRIHTIIVKGIRTMSAPAITERLSDMCDEYWQFYMTMHDKDCEVQESVQAWFHFQAYRKILFEYGWWDADMNQPKDWTTEDAL